jgi:hypothetical protein
VISASITAVKSKKLSQLDIMTNILKANRNRSHSANILHVLQILSQGECGVLFNVKSSGGIAHFCDTDYKNCPRYQFVQQQKRQSYLEVFRI